MHFPIIKCCERNKTDSAQNGYWSIEIAGKIKKLYFVRIVGKFKKKFGGSLKCFFIKRFWSRFQTNILVGGKYGNLSST